MSAHPSLLTLARSLGVDPDGYRWSLCDVAVQFAEPVDQVEHGGNGSLRPVEWRFHRPDCETQACDENGVPYVFGACDCGFAAHQAARGWDVEEFEGDD